MEPETIPQTLRVEPAASPEALPTPEVPATEPAKLEASPVPAEKMVKPPKAGKKRRDLPETLKVSGEVEEIVSYYSTGNNKPVELSFQDLPTETESILCLAGTKSSSQKAKELEKVLSQTYMVKIGSKGAKAAVMWLKYRHLLPDEMREMESLRKASIEGGTCFVFVDSKPHNIPKKVMPKLQQWLPANIVILPWESQMSESTRKIILGLTLARMNQDITESSRTTTFAKIPAKRA
jgi:hypothetical protein